LRDHKEYVHTAAISPDGRIALTISHDAAILWETATGNVIRTYAEMWKNSKGVFSGNGAQILAMSGGGLAVFGLDRGQPVRESPIGNFSYTGIAWSENGSRAATTHEDGRLILWDTERLVPVATFTSDAPLNCVAISDDGRTVVAGDEGGGVLFFRVEG
jgi:WD40 repeat protein